MSALFVDVTALAARQIEKQNSGGVRTVRLLGTP